MTEKLSYRVKIPELNGLSTTEKLAIRLDIIEEKQTEKAKALQRISEYLQVLDVKRSELDVLELEVLRLVKKKLEEQ